MKKNLLLALFVVFSFSALGGALFYSRSVQSQREDINKQSDAGGTLVQAAVPGEKPSWTSPGAAALTGEPGAAGNTGNTGNAAAAVPTNPASSPAAPPEAAAPPLAAAAAGASPPGSGGAEPGAQPPSGQREALRSQIEQEYISRLQSTASAYEARLNSLISAAINEYKAAKEADPGADVTPIFNKYYSAGKALEAECDSKFYSILSAFENKLKANSFPLDAAVKAREAYEARKSARAGQLISGKP